MNINAVGYPLEARANSWSAASAVAYVAPNGSDISPDASLPLTSQILAVDELQAAVDTFNQFVPMAANNLLFSIDEDSGKLVVKIVDSSTQDVIRQIPSEDALEISRSLDKLKGLLLNSQA